MEDDLKKKSKMTFKKNKNGRRPHFLFDEQQEWQPQKYGRWPKKIRNGRQPQKK
jgi:hypothetical protein